jgi:branched-chain amino acid transport system substrate-binding protein
VPGAGFGSLPNVLRLIRSDNGRTSRPRALFAAATVVAACFALTSCTAQPAPASVSTPTATLAPLPAGDGVLRIGTEFPTSGASAFLAPAQLAGVDLAVRDINEAGGVLGKPVEVFHKDSGDVAGTVLEKSFADLLAEKVDVLIGPSSSVLAQRLLPKSIEAKVPMISPAATSPLLSARAYNGWFFRTIPSAALESSALAQVIAKGGPAKVAIVYFDDATDTAIHDTLAAALKPTASTLVAAEEFTADTKDLAATVAAVAKAKPDAVVLASPFSATSQNEALITALSAAGLGGAKLWLTSQNLADYSQALPAGVLNGVGGVLEGAQPYADFRKRVLAVGPSVTDYRYAAEAYDATILAALAATVERNDSGAAIARALPSVSSGGVKCTSFVECLDVLKTQKDIDYDGISGPLGIGRTGDPAPAHYSVLKYGAGNTYSIVGEILAG